MNLSMKKLRVSMKWHFSVKKDMSGFFLNNVKIENHLELKEYYRLHFLIHNRYTCLQ